MCGLTVLHTVGNYRATKQWRWNAHLGQWSKVSYEAGAWFKPQEYAVGNLAQLVDVLDLVRRDPRAAIVRGELTPAAREQLADDPQTLIRRRKLKKGDVEPQLTEAPRRWLMVDIDNFPLPDWADLVDDPAAAIDAAIYELLPPAFHDVTCWWQLSASAGFSPGLLKVHLFFWLTDAASNAHIKTVFEQSAPSIDRAPFNGVQLHFIADPIIEGGHDPIPRRTGWRRGLEEAVELPALRPRENRPPQVGAGVVTRGGSHLDALAYLGDGDGLDGFHAPLRKATMIYARRAARYGERNDDGLKADLLDAIRAAPRRLGRDLSTYDGTYLQRLIDGAFALLAGDGDIQTMRPHYAAPSGSREEARNAISRHVAAFFDRTLAWHGLDCGDRPEAEHAAIVADVGLGKSTATRRHLAKYIEEARRKGLPHRALWLVPTHKLGAEALDDMVAQGISVAIYRGRDAVIPGTGDAENDQPPQKMCLNLPAVMDALAANYDVERSVCGSAKPGEPACPFRHDCSYQKQKIEAAAADVVVATHPSLIRQLPKKVMNGSGLSAIDESWWPGGLHPNVPVRIAAFAEEPLNHPVLRKGASQGRYRRPVDEAATNDLHASSVKAQAAFLATEDDALISRKTLMSVGLTADECAEAAKLERRRKVEGTIRPGMSPAARKEGVQAAAGNAMIGRRAAVWEEMRALLAGDAEHTGRLQVSTRKDGDGTTARVVLLHSRAKVHASIAALPMLLLDATMPVDVVRHFLPRLSVRARVQAAAPQMRVHQITGGFGKTSLVASEKAAPEENQRRDRLVGQLVDFARLNGRGNALVVTYEAIEGRFALPGFRTGHFNAIAGLDEFRDVAAGFIIGRPFPDASELRTLALALTGRPIPPEASRLETRGALMADGSGASVSVRAYADPDLEALRSAITENEIVQAIGRVRGVNREADNPVDVFVLADVALPLPLASLRSWNATRPDDLDRMIARGVLLFSPADAAKAYPDLFPTVEAAKKTIQRGRPESYFGDIPLGIGTLRGMSPKSWSQVTYRPTGRGQQNRQLFVRPDLLDGLRNWLETVCGAPLGHFAAAKQRHDPQAVEMRPRVPSVTLAASAPLEALQPAVIARGPSSAPTAGTGKAASPRPLLLRSPAPAEDLPANLGGVVPNSARPEALSAIRAPP
jgi:hypothetical protein